MFALLLAGCGPRSIEIDVGDSAPPTGDSELRFDSDLELAPGDTSAEPEETGDSVADTPDLFQADTTWEFELTIARDAWEDLSRDGRNYAPATLIWEDVQVGVQIHIKGSSSWQDISDKPALVVDVNRDDPDQEFMGVKKFYLQNECYDPSDMSSVLSYGFYREWGYPASKTNYANLAVNGENYGLYVVLEAHNDDFLEQWFSDPNGNLYENREAYCDIGDLACMELEEVDEGNHDAFLRLAAAGRTSGDAWLGAIQGAMNYQQMVDALALEMGIVHWDSYSYDLSNYQLYHEPTLDQFTLLTQSMDLDYGFRPWSYPTCGQYGMDLDKYDMGMLASACENNATCHADLVAAVERVADFLENAGGAARVVALDARIGNDVRNDPKRYYTDGEYDRHVACLQSFFDERPGQLREWAAAQ